MAEPLTVADDEDEGTVYVPKADCDALAQRVAELERIYNTPCPACGYERIPITDADFAEPEHG